MDLIRRAWAWTLDYAYVGFWQLHGLLVRDDPARYLEAGPEPARGTAKLPVLLIPGVYEPWQFMRPVAAHLHRAGHPVHVVEKLGYNRGSVPAMAALAAKYLEERDLRDVVIVAHSKGGLIGKYLMTLPGSRVSRLVAINTPFSGSIYANFFVLPSIRAFAPRNRTLVSLGSNLEVNSRITSIYGRFDPHIPGGSFLKGARNIQLETMGHFRPIADRRVLKMVDEAIAAAE
ncbi:triacylglycerol lipase [uncultured Arthrobacter sp.]|uniref:esterase/lipase family protein n=1 Tax=uncultured Arthrobacter sp. TaxID=114050 RepID=UPI0025ED3FF6|nr:alpha/beta fold hydrolase [uncultured Arthrobacter sp.]